jgi:predicted DNA-binding protein (UPF0251 family)
MAELMKVKRLKLKSVSGANTIPSGVMQTIILHAMQLPRGARELFLLCDVQRCSLAEAAANLGISQAAANKKLKRARGRMQVVLDRLLAHNAKEQAPAVAQATNLRGPGPQM